MAAVLQFMRTESMNDRSRPTPPPTHSSADRYIPLQANFSDTPVLFIDAHADISDLHDCASVRISTATDLLESLTCLNITNTCDRDIARFANAAYLLLRDGVDLLDAARQRRGN
jgi:hypothetical protein